ncbi:MAG: hypothetical protein ACKPCM_19950 [Pseudanabaena sp.]
MELNFDEDMQHLLQLIGTCSGVPISSYTLAKILMRQEHPLGQDFPKEVKILQEMFEDGLIQKSSTNEHSGYVISDKGKELLAELQDIPLAE